MVYTIEEILEKSKREANGVSFEDALKRTRELRKSLVNLKFHFYVFQSLENSTIS